MCAPVTHIIFALNFLALVPNKFDKKDFIIGTSFPDIRYVAKNLKRQDTHHMPISLSHVLNEKNSFNAGMLYHSYVDYIHHIWMDKRKIYYLHPNQFPKINAIKFYEDLNYYHKVNNWDHIRSWFGNDLLPEEKKFNVDISILNAWHKALRLYLKNPFEKNRRLNFFYIADISKYNFKNSAQGVIKKRLLYKVCEHWYSNIEENLKSYSVAMKQIVLDFYDHFDKKMRLDYEKFKN